MGEFECCYELKRLKAFVGDEMLRSDYQTVTVMRLKIVQLTAQLAATRRINEQLMRGNDKLEALLDKCKCNA